MIAYLVCYDVAHPDRLRRVYRVMRGYGDHLQYSVFHCVLSARQRATLEATLRDVIHADEDQVLFVTLGDAEGDRSKRMWALGIPFVHPERCVKVIG